MEDPFITTELLDNLLLYPLSYRGKSLGIIDYGNTGVNANSRRESASSSADMKIAGGAYPI